MPVCLDPHTPTKQTLAGVFKFDFEEQDLDEAAVRQMVWEEMDAYDK